MRKCAAVAGAEHARVRGDSSGGQQGRVPGLAVVTLLLGRHLITIKIGSVTPGESYTYEVLILAWNLAALAMHTLSIECCGRGGV